MKTKFFLLLLITVFASRLAAYNINWLHETDLPARVQGLVCDKDKSIYQYGSNFPDDLKLPLSNTHILTDTSGSFLVKYSPDGTLAFVKRWKGMNFLINKIIYDGNETFYFTGLFSGILTIDGIQIKSRGSGDGVVGKMDRTGTILWMSTIGAGRDEWAESLCLDPASSRLVVTGTLSDSLYVNSEYLGKQQQSAFLLLMDLSGNLRDYRMYDFLAQRNDEDNSGRELVYHQGIYLWLADQEGAYWNGDSIVARVHGRYLLKVKPDLDTLWSRYVTGPACYYGFVAKDLCATTSGAIYLHRYCSSKYGGTGYLERREALNGNVVWTEEHEDGGFYSTHTDANDLYATAVVDANYTPGPEANSGNDIVRRYSSLNTIVDSFKIIQQDLYLTHVVASGPDHVYVAGYAYNTVVIGTHTISAVSGEPPADFLFRLEQSSTSMSEEALSGSVRLYPNPSSASVTLQVSDLLLGSKVCVLNVLGECVGRQEARELRTDFDVSSLPAGVYLFEISKGSRKLTRKVLVE